MANRPPQMLPKQVVLTKIKRIAETLIALGTAFEETGQTEFAGILAQCVKDMTAIHETVEQL